MAERFSIRSKRPGCIVPGRRRAETDFGSPASPVPFLMRDRAARKCRSPSPTRGTASCEERHVAVNVAGPKTFIGAMFPSEAAEGLHVALVDRHDEVRFLPRFRCAARGKGPFAEIGIQQANADFARKKGNGGHGIRAGSGAVPWAPPGRRRSAEVPGERRGTETSLPDQRGHMVHVLCRRPPARCAHISCMSEEAMREITLSCCLRIFAGIA
jgi:hypothetical protein